MKLLYRCSKCGKIVYRDPMISGSGRIRKTPAKRIKSFCEKTGKDTFLIRLRKAKLTK